ncbi:cytochrome P450 [Belnapia sp. T6]|uniref:Cytochrome P450 n=1 Tax=Belnapia mucosa TaxID=2804532 RepID=A0ABS1V0R0_9PROT|nr:cytochrome P450 [Belnapia mucosa]MBL6455281.1 cytochrome P450 [Belnapia mucosa]
MPSIPRDKPIDSSLAFLADGYEFVRKRCERFGSDIFETRLLGQRFYCVRGEDAARMFYEPDRFTRNGALPGFVLRLLQDQGSVATLDAEAHRRRKAMFMALMTPGRLDAMARLAAEGLRARARLWPERGPVRLHDEFRAVLGQAVLAWAGVRLDAAEADRFTRRIGAMIDHAGTAGPSNWLARMRRWGAEATLRCLIEDVRAGRATPPEDSAAHAIAWHRDLNGELLTPGIGAVEMLNILRPTVAIARFVTFAVLALHRHPESRERLATDDAYLHAFVQEVRRLAPFFPAVAGIARRPFTWRDHQFLKGDRFILDLYGTDRDVRAWDDPESFRPERFLAWLGNSFTMIPQGGGDHHSNHRCAGEWLTIAVMESMLRVLTRDIDYDVPPQKLGVSTAALPALPRSGLVVAVRAVR